MLKKLIISIGKPAVSSCLKNIYKINKFYVTNGSTKKPSLKTKTILTSDISFEAEEEPKIKKIKKLKISDGEESEALENTTTRKKAKKKESNPEKQDDNIDSNIKKSRSRKASSIEEEANTPKVRKTNSRKIASESANAEKEIKLPAKPKKTTKKASTKAMTQEINNNSTESSLINMENILDKENESDEYNSRVGAKNKSKQAKISEESKYSDKQKKTKATKTSKKKQDEQSSIQETGAQFNTLKSNKNFN